MSLSLQFQSPELADALRADREGKVGLMDDLLRRGVEEGRLPQGLDPLTMLDLVFGPLMLSALTGRVEMLDETGDFVVGRVLAPYADGAS